ncbi:MAG TPA: hypothetical protein VF229_04225, partial [Burkholderiaceae bacterium]
MLQPTNPEARRENRRQESHDGRCHRRLSNVLFRAVVASGAALSSLLAVQAADAAGLGRLNVQSALGQPLRAEVEVPAVGRDEASSLQIRLAPASAFRQANLEFNPALTQLKFDLVTRPDGTYAVRISSAQ